MHHRRTPRHKARKRPSGPVSCPALSQIKPHTPLLVVSFRQSLQVSPLRAYYPQNPHTQDFSCTTPRAAQSASFTARTKTVSNRFRSSSLRPSSPRASKGAAFASVRPVRVFAFHLSPNYPAPLVRRHRTCPRPLAASSTAPTTWCTHPTTDLLTAAFTIDTIGAGITAAAGTRLALQSHAITLQLRTHHFS